MTRPPDDERVTRQFEQRSAWWDRIYQQTSLEARILRRRQQVALAWIDELLLPKGARVLEVGYGAGGTTVQLAKRGYLAYARPGAADPTPAWSVRRRLRHSGLVPIRQTTVGFGPFTFLGRTLLSANRSVRVDEALQRRADSDSELLRSAGRLHLVLTHKPDRA